MHRRADTDTDTDTYINTHTDIESDKQTNIRTDEHKHKHKHTITPRYHTIITTKTYYPTTPHSFYMHALSSHHLLSLFLQPPLDDAELSRLLGYKGAGWANFVPEVSGDVQMCFISLRRHKRLLSGNKQLSAQRYIKRRHCYRALYEALNKLHHVFYLCFFSLTLFLSLPLSLSHTHIPSILLTHPLPLSLSLTHTQQTTHSHAHSLCHTHTYTHTLSLYRSLSHTHVHTNSLSLMLVATRTADGYAGRRTAQRSRGAVGAAGFRKRTFGRIECHLPAVPALPHSRQDGQG